MAKISSFIIAMIIFAMVLVGGFGALMGGIYAGYNITTYNESKVDNYNTLSSISTQVEEIENKTQSLQSKSGVIDVLGGFFESGYNAMVLSYNSMSIFSTMAAQSREDIPILDNINIFYIGITTIVMVIVIFIILRIVLKGGDI